MLRRRFLSLGAATGVLGAAGACATATTREQRVAPFYPAVPSARALDAREYAVLAAIQDHLLPSAPGSPGARDVAAVDFLDETLARDELAPRVARRLREGALDVERAALALFGASVTTLSHDQREEVLRSLTRAYKGRRFLRYLLQHTLEAFLGDPVHGGNPDGIAWRYLEHRAGYPRPSSREIPRP